MFETLVDDLAEKLARSDVHFGHGADNARDEAALLVRGFLRRVARDHVTAADRPALLAMLEQRIRDRIPTAYLTGEAWFAGYRFEVEPGVMIPRSPIGELIEGGFVPWLRRAPANILDLCCGSGCIGIAAALAFPDARLTLTDIDAHALETASANVAAHDLGARTRVVQGSLFDGVEAERFDLVLCNPPYVSAMDLHTMPKEFRHEPTVGLSGGADGLDLWRQILAALPPHLTANGTLIGEVGNSAERLKTAFALPFIWPELARAVRLEDGGFGVFVLDAHALV